MVSVMAAAAFSICSMRSSVTLFSGMIFGLLSTSLRLPFSLYTSPAGGQGASRTRFIRVQLTLSLPRAYLEHTSSLP